MPAAITATNSYLVVEGTINTGNDSTIIKLSRTVKIDTTARSTPELHAIVTVESDSHAVYQLYETTPGTYASPSLNLPITQQYRLNIVTSDGGKYQSDFVETKQSPPIDSVGYTVKSNGVQVNLNTHDPSNHSIYYRWDYVETWMFHSVYSSAVMLVHSPKDSLVYRDQQNQLYTCWQNARSSTIVLGSSAKLTTDVIRDAPITFLSANSERLSARYSILVRQHALSKDAFSYWEQLKKNTEQLGSIFDAQPSQLIGNIHSLNNPSEPVIGFISAGSVSEKRIFIDSRDLPAWAPVDYYSCKRDTFYFKNPVTGANDVKTYLYSGSYFGINAIVIPMIEKIIGYTASSRECTDCTLRGVNKAPAFWK
jgi:hypothetical protein